MQCLRYLTFIKIIFHSQCDFINISVLIRNNKWVAFDDDTSIDIKVKYSRVRGLAGLALKDLTQDGGEECGGTLLNAAHKALHKQTRAPRGAILQSLEREILQSSRQTLSNVHESPYRISRVIDVEGKIHVVRQVRYY